MTSEKDYGDARTAYWHGVDFTATARLALWPQRAGRHQHGPRRSRQLRRHRGAARAPRDRPRRFVRRHREMVDVVQGLASYTVPKIDVLVSASMRSVEVAGGGGVATSGLSLAANYVVPNTCTPTSPAGCYSIQQALGRLPANATRRADDDGEPAEPGAALYAAAHESRRHALRQDPSFRGPAG